jgi:cytochrome c556
MRALAEDSTPIFDAIGYVDATFERRRDGFISEVDKGLVAGADCALIGTALKQIADACEACHHDTR